MFEPRSSCDTPQPDPAAERTERHLRMLQELAEIGMDLAREVRRQALDEADEAPSATDFALVFSRIARAVRQTVALEAKLAEDGGTGHAEHVPLSVSDRWRSARRKRQVRQIVGQVIEAEASGDFEANRLFAERNERLEDGDEEADFADRPIGELVARICVDLGVPLDLSLFEDADWAIEEAARLSRAKREGEGRERAAAGCAAVPPAPAMTHPEPALARPSG